MVLRSTAVSRHRTLEKSHGRIERRTYTATGDIAWLTKSHPGWKGLKSVVMVESMWEIVGGKTESETRFYISSLSADAERQGEAIRGHWGIENSHHWVMDMRSATTSAASAPPTPRPTSPPSSTWPATSCGMAPASRASASSAASPPGTTTTWSA